MFSQVFQHAQHALGAAFTNRFHVAAFLQQLTAHIQGEVSRVDHAFDKAQVGGQQGFCVVHDEHAFDVELDACRLFPVVQVHGRFAGDVQQLGVLGAALHAVVGVGQWCLKVVTDLLVKLVVFVSADVFFGSSPNSAAFVNRFPLAGFDHATGLAATLFVILVDQLAVFPLFLFHHDGQADVVGVFVDDAFQLPGAGVIHSVVKQMQDHARSPLGTGDALHLKVARAAADPAHALRVLHAGAAGLHGDFVGHDKAGVKAHAKLANELRVGLLVATEFAHKVFGTALGNRAQMVDGLLRAHADAVVGNGERFGVFVKGHFDLELGVALVQATVVDGFKAQFVAGVRRIADQLAQKNLFVGIQRVGDEVQQLRNFGLEGKGLFGHLSMVNLTIEM